ncbi:unnamed protein product [Lathyrus sativus]|nr:unnamed protein product [Lathyrus sativus]
MLSQFKIDGQPTMSILQFANDTLLIGDGSTSNIWAFKDILRAFELTSGLKTNYSKSCLYEILEPDFLVDAEDFLHYKSRKLSFSFLGITVSGNHCHYPFWKPILICLRNKLSNWNGRNLSIGGRFLWARNSSKTFIPWVSWNSVCKSKEDGGLGIKHVDRFNRALLAKWLWRFQTGGNEIWRKTLTNRYDNLSIKMQTYLDVDNSKSDSPWMKDIMTNASLNSHANF